MLWMLLLQSFDMGSRNCQEFPGPDGSLVKLSRRGEGNCRGCYGVSRVPGSQLGALEKEKYIN